MKDAEKLLGIIKEETDGVDTKVENAVKKMKEFCTEKGDVVSALIELSKLVDQKQYTAILNAIKDIHKQYEKFEEDALLVVDAQHLTKYTESIKIALLLYAKNKFNNKELALLTSCF
jgi:predicted translin family RNA/ssDNA-binding protein